MLKTFSFYFPFKFKLPCFQLTNYQQLKINISYIQLSMQLADQLSNRLFSKGLPSNKKHQI